MCDCPCHTTPIIVDKNIYQYCEECCDGEPNTEITMKLGELMVLVADLDKALTAQRYDATPITFQQHLRLRQRVRDAAFNTQDLLANLSNI